MEMHEGQELKKRLESACAWLFESGIYRRSPGSGGDGGISAGYDFREKKLLFLYTEITGYGISLLVRMRQWFLKDGYLDDALRSARYLERLAGADGALFHCRPYSGGAPCADAYVFDNGICLNGLLDLYGCVKEKWVLDLCERIGGWVMTMQSPDGSFRAADGGESLGKRLDRSFFGDRCSLHLKLAIPLLKLAGATGDERYGIAADRAASWGALQQRESGCFRAGEGDESVFTHSHCYALEGAIFAADARRDDKLFESAVKGGKWLAEVQNRDGSFYASYSARGKRIGCFKAADATAQAARISTILYAMTGDIIFKEAARKAVSFLLSMQALSSADPSAKGGFYYHSLELPFYRFVKKTQYSWVTIFAVHAMICYQQLLVTGFDRKAAAELIKEIF